jgi:pimeloyl-ACP methyl ester carboxylesterase
VSNGQYVELPGVRTWYEVEGAGEPVVLLHGGFCTNETWYAQRADFAAKHKLFLPERRAHGHTPDVPGPMHYADMARDTADFLEKVVKGPAHLVGWSDGAIVALHVAIARPDLVWKLVTIGAQFKPSYDFPSMAAMFESMTAEGPELATFRAAYEAASPDGAAHWPEVVAKMIAMFRTEPKLAPQELAKIKARTLVLAGDDDLTPVEHAADLYRAIPNAELAIVPGTSHALLMEKPRLVNGLILDFLASDAAPTFMPIRRAGVPS